MRYKVLGLVDCFNNPGFGPLTQHRAMASTSFLGRYAYIDFPLSNFLNSGIPSIGILCQNHIRSLSKHVGNGRSWISNTKIGDFQVLYDEPNVANPGYNTDGACLFENMQFLKGQHPDYVVIASPHMVYECDYSKLLEEHIQSGDRISLLYTHISSGLKTSFINQRKIEVSPRGKVTHMELNRGDVDEGDISLGCMILDYPMLESLMEYAAGTSSFFNLADVLSYLSASVLIRAVKIDGYVRCFDSLSHHLKYSLELLNEDVYHSLFQENWPIHTRTYDTPPTLYHEETSIQNAYVANGCDIQGTVINSIIGRNVRIKKGAVVKDSIISSNVLIGENVKLTGTVVDRDASVIHANEIEGSIDNPMYIARGDIV